MPYEYIYFAVRGKGHHIRYLLVDNLPETEWTDKIVSFEEWGSGFKQTMKFKQLPCLRDGKLELPQTGAIIRHLARKLNLYGSGSEEQAKMDMLHEGMVDQRDKMLKIVFTKGDFDKEKEDYVQGLPESFKVFENSLKENKEGKEYFVGDKISFVDYCIYDLIKNHLPWAPKLLDTLPCLEGFVQRMEARPGMMKYLASDAHKKIPITPNPRLQ